MKKYLAKNLLILFMIFSSCKGEIFESTNTLECMENYARVELYITDLTTNERIRIELNEDNSFSTGKTYKREYKFECLGFLHENDLVPTSYMSENFIGRLYLREKFQHFPGRAFLVSTTVSNDQITFYWDYESCQELGNERLTSYTSLDSASVFNEENEIDGRFREATVDLETDKIYFGVKFQRGNDSSSLAVTYSPIWNSEM